MKLEDTEKLNQLSKKYKIRLSDLELKAMLGDSIEEIERYCKERQFYKKLGLSEQLQKEVESMARKIDFYTKSIKALHKVGWSNNSDVMTNFHNERAMLINKIEQKSNYKLIVKFDKQNKAKIYDREKYLKSLEKRK